MKQNSRSGRAKFSQAEQVVLGLLDISLCNNFDNDKDTGICITRWKDSKVVMMASTYAGVNPIKKPQRYSKAEKKRVEITQPNVVAEYNYGMGGVDRFDENIAAYMITQRSKKWWWRQFSDFVSTWRYKIHIRFIVFKQERYLRS